MTAQHKPTSLPSEAISIFSAGQWVHDGTHAAAYDATELDKAAFDKYCAYITEANAQCDALQARCESLEALINTPEIDAFLRAVHIEAAHQVERWGTAHDRAKRPADWFWLIGYLAGKALHAAVDSEQDKALHHCVSTAAALYNWHCALKGVDVRMCPGRSDLAEVVDSAFPGEAPPIAPAQARG